MKVESYGAFLEDSGNRPLKQALQLGVLDFVLDDFEFGDETVGGAVGS